MRIKSVHLQDYKRFVDLTLTEIPENARLVVLIGPNGSGKSSLFDAFLLKSWSPSINHDTSREGSYEGYYNRGLVLQRQFIWQGGFRDQFEPDNVLP